MAQLSDLTLSHRLFMQAYRYRSVDWRPGASLGKPLSEIKLVLITTAGLHLPGQPAFDHRIRGGDCSFREVPGEVDVQSLLIDHRSSAFDQAGAIEDRNLVFPLERFRELIEDKVIGSLNHKHFSLMGSITAPARLVNETAPSIAASLHEDRVDAAFLVPV